MSGGVSKRVYTNRRNVDFDGGVKKAGLPGSIGIPVMLRRFVARRAPDGGKESSSNVEISFGGTLKCTITTTPNPNSNCDTQFGVSLAWSPDGTSLAVGAPFYDDPQNTDNNTGRVYVYQ